MLLGLFESDPTLTAARKGAVIAERHYYGSQFEATLTGYAAPCGGRLAPGKYRGPERLLRRLRQLIESIHDTFKGQLDVNTTAGTPHSGSGSASCSGCWPSPPLLAQRPQRTDPHNQ